MCCKYSFLAEMLLKQEFNVKQGIQSGTAQCCKQAVKHKKKSP